MWVNLFLSPKNRKLLLVPSAHIQVKFRDHCIVWHLECDIKRKEEVCPFVDCLLCSPGLVLQSDLDLLSGRDRRLSILAQQALFSLHVVSLLFLSLLLLACLSSLLSVLPSSPALSLPSFLHSIDVCDMRRVCVHDKGTVKEVSWEQIHQLEFTKNRWSPSKKFKRTACFSLGWFSEAEFKSSRFPNFKTQ